MRNFNDFIRALGGIHNVLSGIAGKIDLIPVPGSGGTSLVIDETLSECGTYKGHTMYSIVVQDDTLTSATQTQSKKVSSTITSEDYLFVGCMIMRDKYSLPALSGEQDNIKTAIVDLASDGLYLKAQGNGSGQYNLTVRAVVFLADKSA